MNRYKDCEHRARPEVVCPLDPEGIEKDEVISKKCVLNGNVCPREVKIECRRYNPTGRCCPECGGVELHEEMCSSGSSLGRFSCFDSFEIHPMFMGHFVKEGQVEIYEEVCEPNKATKWSIYGHYRREDKRSGLDCVADCRSMTVAMAFKVLLDEYLKNRAIG